jgi:2-haloacid dehalogenase
MTSRGIVIFDVNETLSDMAPMAQRFAEVGAPELMAEVWFASLLRDGFALTSTGATERFAVIGAGALRSVLSGVDLTMDLSSAVQHVMDGFSSLGLHPDVPDGIRALAAGGARLFTLTNGSVQVAERLFGAAGISEHFEGLLSVDDAGVWKPAPGAYAYAGRMCGADPTDMILVAVHPWDIDGAARAGLRTCWINRRDDPYPEYFRLPEITVTALPELAGYLT